MYTRKQFLVDVAALDDTGHRIVQRILDKILPKWSETYQEMYLREGAGASDCSLIRTQLSHLLWNEKTISMAEAEAFRQRFSKLLSEKGLE